MTAPIYPSAWWLTVPEICADLRITPAEYTAWSQDGKAPVPEVGQDGTGRVHHTDYETWLDSMREDDPECKDTDR